MKPRHVLAIILLSLGLILAFLPLSARYSFHEKPSALLTSLLDENSYLTVDQVARDIVGADSTIQLIDVRSPEEFDQFTLPGAVNMPYDSLLEMDLESYLDRVNIKNIFFSNGDITANYALTVARGLGYANCHVMKGGMNDWFKTVMNSEFTGERITARENALFENRSKAGKMFTELNSLPDSLKLLYRSAREIERKKLDGGCE